jgi:DNA-binding transcriptional ArsR family regulator
MGAQRYEPDYEMEEFFEAGEPGHFRAFADPTRQRIVSLLQERAATTKQLAGALGLSPGTVGHHLKVLEEAGLIRVVRTRKVRAMTEKYYGNTYRRVTFTARNFAWREELPGVSPQFMLQQAIDEYDDSVLYEEREGSVLPMSTRSHARVPASHAEEFAKKVLELAEEFEVEPVSGERVYSFVAAVFRTNLPELPENEGENGGS